MAVFGLAVAMAGASTTGVRAGAATSGTWQGTLSLGTYPCPASCFGTLTGSLSGTVAGLNGSGQPFVVTWPDPTNVAVRPNLTASFNYTIVCLGGVSGSAQGSFSLTGGYVDDNGIVSHDGSMTGIIAWASTGPVLQIATSNGVVTGGGKTLATQQIIGAGAGAFVPPTVATCQSLQPITAPVVGSFASPQ